MRENSGTALGIVGATVAFFLALPAVIVVIVYLFITVYAIVKAFGVGGGSAHAVTILLGVLIIVTTLVAAHAALTQFIGRPLTPKKRRR